MGIVLNADVVSFCSVLVAIISAVVSVIAVLIAKRANELSRESNSLALSANVLSSESNSLALRANSISVMNNVSALRVLELDVRFDNDSCEKSDIASALNGVVRVSATVLNEDSNISAFNVYVDPRISPINVSRYDADMVAKAIDPHKQEDIVFDLDLRPLKQQQPCMGNPGERDVGYKVSKKVYWDNGIGVFSREFSFVLRLQVCEPSEGHDSYFDEFAAQVPFWPSVRSSINGSIELSEEIVMEKTRLHFGTQV